MDQAGTAADRDTRAHTGPVVKQVCNWLFLNELNKYSFDILLVSAGSYALPLAYEAKKMGKIGVNTGGDLQLFFGIMGNRWEKSAILKDFQNSKCFGY